MRMDQRDGAALCVATHAIIGGMSRSAGRSWRTFDPSQVVTAPVSASPRAASCRILGLDPGSLRTGYGVIDCSPRGERHVASGVIRTGGGGFVSRLRHIFVEVAALVEQYRPDEVAVERVFVHRNPDSALKLGQARGAAICAAVGGGAEVFEYAPRAIKLAVVGTGAADKAQVQFMIQSLLALADPLAADAADALAVGLCHGQSRRLVTLVAATEGPAR